MAAHVTSIRLSPRQHRCLELVHERQATSKEIAAELGISKATVDSYIAEAVEAVGARDRRDAAAIVFGNRPRAKSGGDSARVSLAVDAAASEVPSTEVGPPSRPWGTRQRPRNTLTLVQTIGWIAAIAIGSIAALALAASVGNGLPSVAWPIISGVGRLTR